MIKYLGSKKKILPAILNLGLPGTSTMVDLFSGTSRVGHAFKKAGVKVTANDLNAYAHTLAACYVAADKSLVEEDATMLIAEFNKLAGSPGYFTKTFCEDSRFFHPKNGERVDAIREAIEKKDLREDLKAVLLVSLMEAADRVDSTCGLQMAYLKKWAPRATNDLELRLPDVVVGAGHALHLDAAAALQVIEPVDLIYVDPPYNQHSYLGNYHVWESLVLWDKPEVYGVACKRVDVKERKSAFNRKREALTAFSEVVNLAAKKSKKLLVSFSNEGFISLTEMTELLSTLGDLEVHEVDYKRYVGAQIGIYNPSGEKTGEVSHLRNVEYLFLLKAHSV